MNDKEDADFFIINCSNKTPHFFANQKISFLHPHAILKENVSAEDVQEEEEKIPITFADIFHRKFHYFPLSRCFCLRKLDIIQKSTSSNKNSRNIRLLYSQPTRERRKKNCERFMMFIRCVLKSLSLFIILTIKWKMSFSSHRSESRRCRNYFIMQLTESLLYFKWERDSWLLI